jgi:hypothetical protein
MYIITRKYWSGMSQHAGGNMRLIILRDRPYRIPGHPCRTVSSLFTPRDEVAVAIILVATIPGALTLEWHVSCCLMTDVLWALYYIIILAERPGVARAGFRTPLSTNGSVTTFPSDRLGKQVPGATGLFRTPSNARQKSNFLKNKVVRERTEPHWGGRWRFINGPHTSDSHIVRKIIQMGFVATNWHTHMPPPEFNHIVACLYSVCLVTLFPIGLYRFPIVGTDRKETTALLINMFLLSCKASSYLVSERTGLAETFPWIRIRIE